MKWNEMTTFQKTICVIGWICGISYLILSFPNLRNSLEIPHAALFPLFSFFGLVRVLHKVTRNWLRDTTL